jgi:hypothetical protein
MVAVKARLFTTEENENTPRQAHGRLRKPGAWGKPSDAAPLWPEIIYIFPPDWIPDNHAPGVISGMTERYIFSGFLRLFPIFSVVKNIALIASTLSILKDSLSVLIFLCGKQHRFYGNRDRFTWVTVCDDNPDWIPDDHAPGVISGMTSACDYILPSPQF